MARRHFRAVASKSSALLLIFQALFTSCCCRPLFDPGCRHSLPQGKACQIVIPSGFQCPWGGSMKIGSLGQIGVGANNDVIGHYSELEMKDRLHFLRLFAFVLNLDQNQYASNCLENFHAPLTINIFNQRACGLRWRRR